MPPRRSRHPKQPIPTFTELDELWDLSRTYSIGSKPGNQHQNLLADAQGELILAEEKFSEAWHTLRKAIEGCDIAEKAVEQCRKGVREVQSTIDDQKKETDDAEKRGKEIAKKYGLEWKMRQGWWGEILRDFEGERFERFVYGKTPDAGETRWRE